MVRRKNKKRFDPRYFLHERLDVEGLAQQVADEPGVEKQLLAIPPEFDERTSKPSYKAAEEFLRDLVLQTEPFASGEEGWVPGQVEAVVDTAFRIIHDRNREF